VEKKYIYHNHINDSILNLPLVWFKVATNKEEINNFIFSKTLILCSSYIIAEGPEILINYAQTATTTDVIKELNNDKEFISNCSLAKYGIIQNIKAFDTDSTDVRGFIGNKADATPIIVAQLYNGIVMCADYHEAANAYLRNIPFVFLIAETALKEYNGPAKYKDEFIRKINTLKII